MSFLDLVRGTEIYQIIYQEGYEEGYQEGLLEGCQEAQQSSRQFYREASLDEIGERFPDLVNEVQDCFDVVVDFPRYIQLWMRLVAARTSEDVRRVLDDARAGEPGTSKADGVL